LPADESNVFRLQIPYLCLAQGFRLPAGDLCVARLAGPGGLDVRVGVPLADAYLEFLGGAVPTEYGALRHASQERPYRLP